MISNITPKDRIEAELIEMDLFLCEATSELADEAQDRGNKLAVYPSST